MQRQILVTDSQMARYLRVKVSWLRSEAEAGRLPHINADGRLLFNRLAVEAVLTERAAREGQADA